MVIDVTRKKGWRDGNYTYRGGNSTIYTEKSTAYTKANTLFQAVDKSDNVAYAAASGARNIALDEYTVAKATFIAANATYFLALASYDAAVIAKTNCPYSFTGTYGSSASYKFNKNCMSGTSGCAGYGLSCIPKLILDTSEKFLCGKDDQVGNCFAKHEFKPLTFDTTSPCASSATPNYYLLQDDCNTTWNNSPLQTIKESSDFLSSGILKVNASDVTNEILRIQRNTTACVQMKWLCSLPYYYLSVYQKVVVTYKWGLAGIDNTRVPFYGQIIAAKNFTGDVAFHISLDQPSYYYNLLSMYKSQGCVILPAIQGVLCNDFKNQGQITMNVETFAGINNWNNKVDFQIKIYDTTDSNIFVNVGVRLRLCFIDNTNTSIYQQYYEVAVGTTSPGNIEGHFNVIFKEFEVDLACAKYNGWIFWQLTPNTAPITFEGINSPVNFLKVDTSKAMSAEVLLYRETLKPDSETASYGTQFIPSFFNTFYITVRIGAIKPFIKSQLAAADLTKKVYFKMMQTGLATIYFPNFICDQTNQGNPCPGQKSVTILRMSSLNTELTDVPSSLLQPKLSSNGNYYYQVDDQVLGSYSFYLYGATQADAQGLFSESFSGFSEKITVSVVCGGETISVLQNYLLQQHHQLGGTIEIPISGYWTFTSSMAECPIQRFEMWSLQAGVWAKTNSHGYYTLKYESDPAKVAVEINKVNPFSVQTVKIVAFTSGNVMKEIVFETSVCGLETISTYTYSMSTPLIVVGQANKGATQSTLKLTQVFYTNNNNCGMLQFEFFQDAALTLKLVGKVTSNADFLLIVDHTTEADYTMYIQGTSLGNVKASIKLEVLICPEEINELTNSIPDKFYMIYDATGSWNEKIFSPLISKMPQCLTVTSYVYNYGSYYSYWYLSLKNCAGSSPCPTTLSYYAGWLWNDNFSIKITKTYSQRYVTHYKGGIGYQEKTYNSWMYIVNKAQASWIEPQNMAQFTDWKIMQYSTGTTGVNKYLSNVIEFEPFKNTKSDLSSSGQPKKVDEYTVSTSDVTNLVHPNIQAPVKMTNGNYQITIPSDIIHKSYMFAIFGATSMETSGFYSTNYFYSQTQMLKVSVFCGNEIISFDQSSPYVLGGDGLTLLDLGSRNIFNVPQVSSSKPECPILEFVPYDTSLVGGLAYSSVNFNFVDLLAGGKIVTKIDYAQNVPHVSEFFMRASTESGVTFGIYNYYHFKIIVCGGETFTMTNTTEYRQQWPQKEEGEKFTIPFDEYWGWFEMVLQVGNERFCNTTYHLRDENCTSQYQSSYVYIDSHKDIIVNQSEPFLKQKICLYSESKGHKIVQKLIDFEICGVRIQTFTKQVNVKILIDGSTDPIEILELDLRSYFDVRSDYCVITYFELQQSVTKETNIDLYSPANFEKHRTGKYIKFNLKDNIITIKQNDKSLMSMQKGQILNVLKYVKAVTAQGHYSMQPINFEFIKTYNILPYFIGTKKLEDWVITVQQEQVLKGNDDPFILFLPRFKDEEGNTVKLDFSDPEMQEWIKLKKDEAEGLYSLVIDPVKVTYKDEGTHLFNILLSDNVSPGVFNTYPLTVQLTYVQFAYADIVQQETAMKEDLSKKVQEKKIQFDGSVPSPTVRIANFTVDHKLSLVFDQKMEVNKSLDFSKVLQFKTINGLSGKETMGRYLSNHRILSDNDGLGPNQNFEWEVYVHEPKLIIFRVHYQDIQQVSTVSKDEMVITVLDLSQLRSEGTLAPLSSSSIVSSLQCGNVQNSMCQSIPPFLKEDTKNQIDSATQILQGSISALIQANIFLMIPLGKSLSSLWDIIRPLQYLSIIALIQVLYPSALYVYFVNMIDIASLDLFFGLKITEFLFTFKSGTEPLNSHFEEFGVGNTVYLLNSSSIILPIVPLIILQYLLLKLVKKLIKQNFEQPYLRKLGMYIGLLDQDIFGNLSKLILEGSFDLTFCTLINLYTILNLDTQSELMLNFTSASDFFNTIITFVSLLVVVLLMPCYTIIYAYRFFYDNSLTAERRQAIAQSPLFAENSRQSFLGMINEAFFMIRRTLTIAMIVFCPYPIFQIQVILVMSIMYCMYLLHFKPIDNIRLQIINEITITVVAYGFYILIDIAGAYEGKSFVGKAVIGSITINVVYNVVRVAIITSTQVYYSAKVAIKSTKKSMKVQKIFNDFKVVTQEFPGRFLVTEFLIKQNEAILRSKSWNNQQQWLVENGFEFSYLPEYKQFLIEIRKFKFCQNNEVIQNNSQTRYVAKKLIIKDQLQQKIKPLKVIPKVNENKFDKKWSQKQTKKLAPIQEQRETTEGNGDDLEQEKPQILKNLRNLVRFPEKIQILQDFELEIEKLKEVINSLQGQTSKSKVLKALVRVQDHYLSLEEDNKYAKIKSRQKDLRFIKDLEEKVTDEVNYFLCLSDNEEHVFLKQQNIIQLVSSTNQVTKTTEINDLNKILRAQKKKIVNLFPGAGIFGLKSSQSNVSSILCCIQILLSLRSAKDYYMKKLYDGHGPKSSLTIANFLKNLYRNSCFLRLDPYSSQALEINLDEISHLHSKDPLFFFYQFLKKSSQEMQNKKMSFDEFQSSSIRKHVMYEKKHKFSYLSKMFALQYQTKIVCGSCKVMTQSYTTEFGLNIKLLEKETTLTELLGKNFSSQKIDCECKCGAQVKFIERAITFFPQYLIVGLQRFDGYGNRMSVLGNPVVVFPEMDLSQCASKDLVKEVAEGKDHKEFFDPKNTPHMQKLQKKIDKKVKESNNKYEIQAIICHNGSSMSTGQFYCYVKRSIPKSQDYQQNDSIEDDDQEKLVKLGGRADLFFKRRAKKTKPELIFQDIAEESKKPASEQPAARELVNLSDSECPTERLKQPIDMGGFQILAKSKSRNYLFKKIKDEQMEGGDPEPKAVEEWFLFIDDYHTKVDINEVLRKEKLNIYMVLYKVKP